MENDILAFATCESCKELCDLLTPSPTTKWGFHILWSGWMHGINSWNVKMNVFNIKIRFRAIEIKKWSFYNNLILTKSDIWVLSIENHNYPYQQQYDICVSFRHGKRSIFPIAPYKFSPMREIYPHIYLICGLKPIIIIIHCLKTHADGATAHQVNGCTHKKNSGPIKDQY